MVEQVGCGEPHLIHKVLRRFPVLKRVFLVDRAHLVLGESEGDEFLNKRDAQALLQRADDNQVGDVHAVVALFLWLRHDLDAHVVVDGGGSDGLPVLHLRRHVVQIVLQKLYHLIHIQTQIGEFLPFRQPEALQILFPAPELSGNQLFIVRHQPISLR